MKEFKNVFVPASEILKKTNIDFFLLSLSIFFINVPPIQFPFLGVNLHTLAKAIWLILLARIILGQKRSVFLNLVQNSELIILSLLFLATQALSILSSVNIYIFLSRFDDIFFGFIFLLVSFYMLSKGIQGRIINVFLISVFVDVVFSLFIYFSPNFFRESAGIYLEPSYLQFILYNLSRGRIYYETFSYSIVPIIVYLLLYKGGLGIKAKIFYLTYILTVSLAITLSNVRSFFVLLILSFIGSMVLSYKKIMRAAIIFCVVLVAIYFSLNYALQAQSFNVIDRLLLQDESEDYLTIVSRVDLWEIALQIGLSHPIAGVGMGNFLEYVPYDFKYKNFIEDIYIRKTWPSYEDPHDIFMSLFAESGVIGLSSFILLIFYFLVVDFRILRSKNELSKFFIVSFWSLFFFALFNPSHIIRFWMFFWFFRVMIERSTTYSIFSIKNLSK